MDCRLPTRSVRFRPQSRILFRINNAAPRDQLIWTPMVQQTLEVTLQRAGYALTS